MFEDINVNIATDDYFFKPVRSGGNGHHVKLGKSEKGKKKVCIEVPYYDLINIGDCDGSKKYLITTVSSRVIKVDVKKYSTKGYCVFTPQETCDSEMIVVNPENSIIAINAVVKEYKSANVCVQKYTTSKGKDSEKYYIHCPVKYVGEYVTVIPVDDTLVISRLDDGVRIYSECQEMWSHRVTNAFEYNGKVSVPKSFKDKECIIFRTPEHLI